MIKYDLRKLTKTKIQELCDLLKSEDINFIVDYSEKTNYDVLILNEIDLLSVSKRIQDIVEDLPEVKFSTINEEANKVSFEV